MDFSLTAEQAQIRDMVAEFVDEEVVPRAAEIDASDEFPADLVREMGELGLMGMPFPEEYGGAGLDYHSYAIGLEEISRGSGGLGTVVAAHTSLAGNMLYAFGDERQLEEDLTPLAAGDEIGAFALSEAGAGSELDSTRGTSEPVPIAVTPCTGGTPGEQKLGEDIAGVILADLERSGLFKGIDREAFIQTIRDPGTTPRFADWRAINAQARV
jgi:hypothetical protein